MCVCFCVCIHTYMDLWIFLWGIENAEHGVGGEGGHIGDKVLGDFGDSPHTQPEEKLLTISTRTIYICSIYNDFNLEIKRELSSRWMWMLLIMLFIHIFHVVVAVLVSVVVLHLHRFVTFHFYYRFDIVFIVLRERDRDS